LFPGRLRRRKPTPNQWGRDGEGGSAEETAAMVIDLFGNLVHGQPPSFVLTSHAHASRGSDQLWSMQCVARQMAQQLATMRHDYSAPTASNIPTEVSSRLYLGLEQGGHLVGWLESEEFLRKRIDRIE
jgi:hypothetical protein